MTTRPFKVAALAAVLSACAGPSAGGQQPAPDASLGRIHMYEVPSDRLPAGMVQEAPSPGWIQVDGNGQVEVEPDRASVSIAVETRHAEAAGAAQGNADRMDAVLRALRQAGFEGLELETFGYSVTPEYAVDNSQRTRRIVAYVASNNVRATISDIDAVGRLLDTSIGTGANRVSGISFFASDTEQARTEAMAAAVRDATSEARVIANTLGYQLGPPLEVNGGAQRPVPFMAREGMLSANMVQSAPTPIEAGSQTVTAHVSIRFALGPRTGG